jgi:hypothetical protein
MTAINDITKDKLKSKINTKEYEDNYDKIFSKKKYNLGYPPLTANKPVDSTSDWDEKRVDIVGSNGNDGIHYPNMDDAYERVEKDYENSSS